MYLTPAHTIVVQACLGVLLHPDKNVLRDSLGTLPLFSYASRYWVEHAQVVGVSERTQNGTKCLFDPDKPHFAAWIWVYDPMLLSCWHSALDTLSIILQQPRGFPLHCATFFGFYDIVRVLVMERDKATLLHRASESGRVEVAQLLLDHGKDTTAKDERKSTPLHLASELGRVELA